MKQPHAWQIYDRWLQDDRVAGLDDPSGIELTLTRRLATKDRANCLVCALASGSQLTLVTFDGPPAADPGARLPISWVCRWRTIEGDER